MTPRPPGPEEDDEPRITDTEALFFLLDNAHIPLVRCPRTAAGWEEIQIPVEMDGLDIACLVRFRLFQGALISVRVTQIEDLS